MLTIPICFHSTSFKKKNFWLIWKCWRQAPSFTFYPFIHAWIAQLCHLFFLFFSLRYTSVSIIKSSTWFSSPDRPIKMSCPKLSPHWKVKNGNSDKQNKKQTTKPNPLEWLRNVFLRWKCNWMAESSAVQNKTNIFLALTRVRKVYRWSWGI